MKILFPKLILTYFLLAMPPLCAQQQDIRNENSPENDPGVFAINSNESILKVFVGRAGFLSQMGHNHIIISTDITGDINYQAAPAISSASFTVPVQTLVVDDETERQIAGEGFESVPDKSDIMDTKNNMLGTRVLDSENFPFITALITGQAINDKENTFSVLLEFKGMEIELILNATTHLENNIIVIDAEFELDHTQLGLTPFSVLGGMLRVAEQMRFELHIEALRN